MGCRPHWVYRVRNLVLVDDAGNPTCIVLVMRSVQDDANVAPMFSGNLAALPEPAAIVRSGDHKLLAANDAFLNLAGLAPHDLSNQGLGQEVSGAAAGASAGDGLTLEHASLLLALPGGKASGSRSSIVRLPVTYANQPCFLCSVVDPQTSVTSEFEHGTAASRSHVEPSALCAASPVPLLVLDNAIAVTAVSQAGLDWLSYRLDEVRGRPVTSFMTPASAEYFTAHMWQNLAVGARVRDIRCEFVAKSGAVLSALVSASATLDEAGSISRVIVAPTDDTERARSEDAFAAMFALTPIPMVIRKLDDSRVLDVNDAFLAATGFDTSSVIGHGMEEFGVFDGRAARQQFEAAARSPDGVKNLECHLKTREGDTLDCLISARKVQAFGQTCLLMVLQDISDRRRNETQLFQAIETVMEDTSWFSRSVIEKLATLRSPPRNGSRAAEIGDLTPREREVLGFISHGLADTDIAQKLGLTRSTVRNHVATLYSKIGVHSRSSAIIWARERGINMEWPAAPAANYVRPPLPASKPGLVAMVAKNRRA
jgi:PAS domain S-box-containing protein